MNQQVTEKPRILALDDELLNLELLRFIVERKGFDYLGTSTVKQFYEMLPQHKPDLILLDVIMKESNGFDVCQTVKSRTSLRRYSRNILNR